MIKKQIETIIETFIKDYKQEFVPTTNEIKDIFKYKIYNEVSLQLELGKYLEDKLEGCKIFFEIPMYEKKSDEWDKKEADIVIVNGNDKYAIELKFSQGKNGRVPENMYDFIKDIGFMDEVLDNKKEYKATFNLIVVNSKNYFEGKTTKGVLYKTFRSKQINLEKNKEYKKPTGKESKSITLKNSYTNLKWKEIFEKEDPDYNNYRYLFIKHYKN